MNTSEHLKMNIKKYRAATTLEALAQIKLDLGEDALVLESKQVRNGGFLDFGSETQIEISAPVTGISETFQPKIHVRSAGRLDDNVNILNLTDDDAPATPQYSEERKNLLNTLKMDQAMDGFTNKMPLPPIPKILGTIPQRIISPIKAVEINPSAPRVVHLKKEMPSTFSDEQVVTDKKTLESLPIAPGPLTTATSREFEILRAELREVKFSLGSLSGRRKSQFTPNEFDLKTLGEFLDSPYYESYTELISKGVSPSFARQMISVIIPQVKSGAVGAGEISRQALLQTVTETVKFEPDPLDRHERIILAVIGATGVGKTTTIAKLAACMSLHKRRRVELITLDTYRIAAVKQLKTYAEIIGAGCHVARSVLEMESILSRISPDADVFIDTTGKSPHDLADQCEISDYLSRHTEIKKCLAVQATTHPLDGLAAIGKFEMYGADCLALTKTDETLRPGAMLELAAECSLPLVYFTTGQRVPEDLQPATPANFVSRILCE